jgi:DNA modification methylase
MVFRGGKMRADNQNSRLTGERFKQPKPMIQTTTLWDFPSQHYGDNEQGDGEYAGVTPSYVIWNLLQRYTKPGASVLDPMCGSGTTLDVCKDLDRSGAGFDISPTRADVVKADARRLPVKDATVDFVFVDPPYGTHIKYSGDQACIGELDQRGPDYYAAMEKVFAEIYRVLKDGGYAAVYIQDSFAKGKDFAPLGFELFLRMSVLMQPVDIVCVTRHNKKLKRNHWHTSAIEGNFFLRGFNYLFIFRKNVRKDSERLSHADSGALSFYFRQVAKSKPGEVVTPEALAQAIATDRQILDKKLVRKEGKKNFKKMAREQQKHHFKGKNNDAKRPGRFEPKGKGQKKP